MQEELKFTDMSCRRKLVWPDHMSNHGTVWSHKNSHVQSVQTNPTTLNKLPNSSWPDSEFTYAYNTTTTLSTAPTIDLFCPSIRKTTVKSVRLVRNQNRSPTAKVSRHSSLDIYTWKVDYKTSSIELQPATDRNGFKLISTHSNG